MIKKDNFNYFYKIFWAKISKSATKVLFEISNLTFLERKFFQIRVLLEKINSQKCIRNHIWTRPSFFAEAWIKGHFLRLSHNKKWWAEKHLGLWSLWIHWWRKNSGKKLHKPARLCVADFWPNFNGHFFDFFTEWKVINQKKSQDMVFMNTLVKFSSRNSKFSNFDTLAFFSTNIIFGN